MKLVNRENGQVLAECVRVADTFLLRLRGLMFTPELAAGTCLHIRPCRSVHTFFMKYCIDVLHLDQHNQIVGAEINLAPGKVGAVYRDTVTIVELPAGMIQATQTKVGQVVDFKTLNGSDENVR